MLGLNEGRSEENGTGFLAFRFMIPMVYPKRVEAVQMTGSVHVCAVCICFSYFWSFAIAFFSVLVARFLDTNRFRFTVGDLCCWFRATSASGERAGGAFADGCYERRCQSVSAGRDTAYD